MCDWQWSEWYWRTYTHRKQHINLLIMNFSTGVQCSDNKFILLPGYELVKLPEDAVLCGFTPLTYKDTTPSYASKDLDIELAQFSLRVEKLLFFGTEFVCGLEPPVLKLEIEDGFREYVSVVCTNNSRDSPPSPPELVCDVSIRLKANIMFLWFIRL